MDKRHIVRCPIHGSMEFSAREMALIDSPFFQRLRQITQLGFAGLVFPGATHTRFAHSLGTAHLAGRVFDQLCKGNNYDLRADYNLEQLNYARSLLRFAALLHDVGHPPFSHAAEAVLPRLGQLPMPDFLLDDPNRQATHEDYSHAIIHHLAESRGLISREEASDLVSILSKKHEPSDQLKAKDGRHLIYPLLCQLINGEIDVDRMDYLLRDAYNAGVPYGKFDLDRLIGAMAVYKEDQAGWFLLSLKEEDVPTYENFLLSRIHMFQQIYFHKTLGAFSHYLTRAFVDKELEIEVDGSLEQFLGFTESRLRQALAQVSHKKWSSRILGRVKAKNILRVVGEDTADLARLVMVEEIINRAGIESFVVRSSNQYSSQIEGQVNQGTVMVIQSEFGKTRALPLASRSDLLDTREKRILITQLYVHREDAARAIEEINLKLADG